MNIPTIIVSLIATLCLVGCSKEGGGASTKGKRLVPATAAEVMASPDYKLEHTTGSGLRLYVRELTPEIANTIYTASPDFEFRQGNPYSPYYFLVLIRDGKIIDRDAQFPLRDGEVIDWDAPDAPPNPIKPGDLSEIGDFKHKHKRDKMKQKFEQKFEEMVKEATKGQERPLELPEPTKE